MSRRPLPGYVKLLLCMFTIWLLLWVITPLWVPYSKLHQDFAAAQENMMCPSAPSTTTTFPSSTKPLWKSATRGVFLPRGPLPEKK